MRTIIVVGSLNMDMVFRIPGIPKRGETVMGDGFFMNPGGKGANQAVACARQGANVRMVGTVGADVFGETLIAGLVSSGIDATHVRRTADRSTGTALIMVSGSDNRIVVAAGANATTSSAQIDAALADVCPGDVYLTQMEIPYEAMKHGLIAAKAKGLFTILNPAPAGELDAELLRHVDLIVPNETEAETITGVAASEPHFAAMAIARLLAAGVGEAIVTLGAAGCAHGDHSGIQFASACPVDVVDTTAAGDTFVGAIAVAVANGAKVKDALARANAAAAITISRRGAQCSIPDKDEVDRFMAHRKDVTR